MMMKNQKYLLPLLILLMQAISTLSFVITNAGTSTVTIKLRNYRQLLREDNKWLFSQRLDYGESKHVISNDKESTNTTVLTKNDLRWEEMFAYLIQYTEREGNCHVRTTYKQDGNLGLWLMHQKQKKRNGILQSNREAKLQNLGIVWDSKDEINEKKWKNKFDLLVEYKDRKGHLHVPHNHIVYGMNLGIWLRRQKKLYETDKLLSSRQERLEEIGFEWVIKLVVREEEKEKKWQKMLGLLIQFNDREGHCNVPQKYKEGGVRLGRWMMEQRRIKRIGVLKSSRQEKMEKVGVVWAHIHAQQWEHKFTHLLQFFEREGHCDISRNHKEEGVNLGAWLARQKNKYSKEQLDSSYQQRLEEAGVVWKVVRIWEDYFALFVQFKEREGHCDVPRKYIENGIKLGKWLDAQKVKKRRGKLSSTRIEQLEKVGVVVWSEQDQKWENMFAHLVQFKEREGHCNVPQRRDNDTKKLGVWLIRQRAMKRMGKIDPVRQQRLEDIGIVWVLRLRRKWEDSFAILVGFKEREGHCNVPRMHEENGLNLGQWLIRQKKGNLAGNLDSSQQKVLNKIGIVWEMPGNSWEDLFALLVQFKEREGHCNVPRKHKENGMKLGAWIHNQNTMKKSGKLSSIRLQQLNDIGIIWDRLENKWNDMFAVLVQFKEREGHCNVPVRHKEKGIRLGNWLTKQRTAKRQGKLHSMRQQQLEDIGIVWDILAKS